MKRFLGWSDSKDDPFRKGTITEKTPDEDEDRENDKDGLTVDIGPLIGP